MNPDTTPGATARLRAALEYLGLAPFTHRRRGGGEPRGFVDGHHRYALALLLILVGVFILYALGIALVTIAIMTSRTLYEDYHIEGHVLGLLRKFVLAWGVFWAFSLGTALFGKEAYLPLVGALLKRPRVLVFSARLWMAILLLALFTGLFATYAGTKVRDDARPGKAYFLYENGNRFPRWLFAIGFYPMALAAEQRFGPGNAVMLRVDRESLHRGLREASFIFLGTHGMHQGILVPDGLFKIQDVATGEANPGLQFVYMSGCDQGAGWEDVFKPARVVTFNRLTSVAEHIWWMWIDGPGIIRGLQGQP